VNSLLVYHIGSGHAFFSGVGLIQLAGLSAFLRRGRWLAVCRMISVCAGVILVAVSSRPLPAWFYGIAGAVTLAWFALEGLIKSTHRRLNLGLRYPMPAIWWLGLELALPPFHNRYGDAQRRLATRHGVLLIPKRVLIGVLTSEGATLDTVHLSRRGHALMAETVWGILGGSIGP
jgi:hypothetical protein